MSDRAFVDTNLLVYAHDGSAGVKHEKARELIERLWLDRSGVLSTQVLQELYVSLRKAPQPMPPAEARQVVADYLRWAKEHPKDATYATPGVGSALHFLGALLARDSGVALTHVPYRGVMPGVQDLIGGQVSATLNPLPTLIEFHRAGRIRLLAVTSPQRAASVAQVPTMAELGWKKLEFVEWYGVFASAAVPPATQASLQRRLAQATASPGMAEAERRLEVTPRPLDGKALGQLLAADMASWKVAVQVTGIQLET